MNKNMDKKEIFIPIIKTAAELYYNDYGEDLYIIDNLLPEVGLILICGAVKSGKSFFAQLLANCITTGEDFLNKKINKICSCLYLALEDTEKRINRRLHQLQLSPSNKLMFCFNWCYFIDGINEIKNYCIKNTLIKVVIIDTLGVFSRTRQKTDFQSDYDYLHNLQKVANDLNILIICIHHTRKLRDEFDIYNTILGSIGTIASVDAILLINGYRNSNEAKLNCIARDYSEIIIDIKKDNRCRWEYIGINNKLILKPERQKIIDILKENGEQSPLIISEKIPNSKAKNISNLLNLMYKDGLVEKGSKTGLWKISNNLI